MKLSDYFKAKPDKPIDALIRELTENNTSLSQTIIPVNKSETDALIDSILGEIPIDERKSPSQTLS